MKSRLFLALAAAVVVGMAFLVGPSLLASQHTSAAAAGLQVSGMNRIQKRILSGFASFEAGVGVPSTRAPARTGTRPMHAPAVLCPGNLGRDRLVNQNCLNIADQDLQGRGQAENETAIAQNPFNPSQLVSGFNDYRRGDGNCYGSFSSNGGMRWTDTTIPMGFTRGTAFGNVAREYWEAGGDTSVAWDTRGNAYFSCLTFQRGEPVTNNPDVSSAIYVFRSTGDGGASWNFPGRPAVEAFSTSSTGLPLNDKPYMTVDNHVRSPFRDRVYVTWTLFAPDGTAYLYEVHSNDYGQTFSAPVLVSGTSSLCAVTFHVPTPQGTCNENQFSDPFTGPDGTLYVVFDNYNNPTSNSADNHNQVLLARSTDGGLTFSAPVKVANFYDLPDCATYQGGQDPGRACVPEKGSAANSVFRAANYPSGAVNPANPKQIAVTFGSYINKDSKEANGCVPAGIRPATGQDLYTGVKTPGACNNKIVLSVSADGGATFTGTSTDPRSLPVVNTAPGQARTDQWFQWASYTPAGTLVSSYYDRQYGSDETTGSMDVSVSSSARLARFLVLRATSSSMPLPTQFPDAQGNSLFFGDYSGLTAQSGAHPLWMDTRDPDVFVCPGTAVAGTPPALCRGIEPNGLLANDQNIFTALLPAH